MTLSPMTRKNRILLLFAVALIAIVGTFSLSPISQDLAYHDFADKRTFLGIANFAEVMSNLAFAMVAIFGMIARCDPFCENGADCSLFRRAVCVMYILGWESCFPNPRTLRRTPSC